MNLEVSSDSLVLSRWASILDRTRPMSGLHGLGSGFGSFAPALQGLDRPAIDTVLLYNCPTLFLLAGGTAPCRRFQDVGGERPSLARESVRVSWPADS